MKIGCFQIYISKLLAPVGGRTKRNLTTLRLKDVYCLGRVVV